MKNAVQQFRDLPDPIATFERLFRAALKSLLRDLADAPWYVREREVVNLFVFGHLIPQFQDEKLDIGQVGIEVPVQKFPESSKAKLGKYADIVVWLHNKATVWLTCKPLVHIEWKNISCREKNPSELERQHKQDICDLKRDRQFVCVSYAVLTDQRDRHVELRCTRIADGMPEDFFSSPPRLPATCSESAITVLQGDVQKVRSRRQGCPDCIVSERSRAATNE